MDLYASSLMRGAPKWDEDQSRPKVPIQHQSEVSFNHVRIQVMFASPFSLFQLFVSAFCLLYVMWESRFVNPWAITSEKRPRNYILSISFSYLRTCNFMLICITCLQKELCLFHQKIYKKHLSQYTGLESSINRQRNLHFYWLYQILKWCTLFQGQMSPLLRKHDVWWIIRSLTLSQWSKWLLDGGFHLMLKIFRQYYRPKELHALLKIEASVVYKI